MSKPRPIHTPHRDLRQTPDEAEPSFSYEQESFLLGREEAVEDEFHARLQAGSRRDSSGSLGGTTGSFWRTTPENVNGNAQGPSFSSVNMHAPKPEQVIERKSQPSSLGSVIHNQSLAESEFHHSNSWNGSDGIFSSSGSNGVQRDASKKKEISKQRSAERLRKLEAQTSAIEVGHIHDGGIAPFTTTPNFSEFHHASSLDRSSSDQSTGSILYGKTPITGALLGKSSSLIFPTGVDSSSGDVDSEAAKLKRRKVNLALDNCEAVRFRFKKKLILANLDLSAGDIPLKDLNGTSLGNSLHKLALSGNRLGTVPPKLVQCLPALKHLDLSQCELSQLPEHWNLPKLVRLDLSHNRFTEFPEEGMLEGLPDLQELNMYGNKVAEIIIPTNRKLLSKLETLNLGYNDLVYLPPELDQLKALKKLEVMNNFLAKVPMRVCMMDLKVIDVSSNPVTEPPIETCERGICSMRRYWDCIRMEEQSKRTAMEEVRKKVQRQRKKGMPTPKKGYSFFANRGKSTSSKSSPSLGRKALSETQHSVSAHVLSPTPQITLPNPEQPRKRDELQRANTAPSISIPEEAMVKAPLEVQSSDETQGELQVDASADIPVEEPDDVITVNDTLKVIFVGMAMVGKTSMIKRLIEGKDAKVPTHDERTVGVDIYEWEPKNDRRFEHIDSRIVFQDPELAETCGDVDVKLSVWDFAGQHVYHATHELFFSSRALYVLVWDMGATNRETHRRKASFNGEEKGAFKLSYDSSDEEDCDDIEDEEDALAAENEARRADRALERDIDEKVQFWVDCIRSSAPGAAILPVASFSDYFDRNGGDSEARRRCLLLKQRLLKHEERRMKGIKDRLEDLEKQNRANEPTAVRLRKLLCSYTRPKLLFGEDDDHCVVRVSGTQYTGFDNLTEKIIDIATGREKAKWRYPIFHGHVGARIPRMRLQVRDEVRNMRDKFKVVEWGYFINRLRDAGLTNVEDISDALHFLTNTGELSYFGGVMASKQQPDNPIANGTGNSLACSAPNHTEPKMHQGPMMSEDHIEEMDEIDDEWQVLSIDDTSITVPTTEDGSMTSVDDFMSSGLSQFVFLNPRWLVAAVACILRHDLEREIKETRRLLANGETEKFTRAASFCDSHRNCPVITADDACLLWQAKRITKKAADRAHEYSNNLSITPFEFLQLLLIRFGVFVPIDLSIEKAFLGGKEYAHLIDDSAELSTTDSPAIVPISEPAESSPERPTEVSINNKERTNEMRAKFFFLPSLLGPCEPADAWTYKTTDSWKTTLCHSILFPDGVPPGLMERLTASVLSLIYAVSNRSENISILDHTGKSVSTYEGRLYVKEVLCWRTAFFIKIATEVPNADGVKKESVVEIFTHLADRESHLCVGSQYMGVGARRLVTSARGQVGDGGRKIWKGGYLLVIKAIKRVMSAYGGLEYETQGFCPDCLAKRPVSEAGSWDVSFIKNAVTNGDGTLRCQHGHRINVAFVAGPDVNPRTQIPQPDDLVSDANMVVPVKALLKAVVVVGLWNGRTRKVVRVGSGFIVDRKRGLIVTASHTLMNIWGDRNSPFGEDYYGLPSGKVVIGVIPEGNEENGSKDMAVFRYFAKIVAKDPLLETGECHLDACVLRITTRLENDVGGNGDSCGDEPEILLLNNPRALKNEHLQALKVTDKCELDEQVRVLGYNQGGEGLVRPGETLNRYVDFARGYVCMKFANGDATIGSKSRDRFKPREEIVVICPTICGHSGGPCVNQQGEVVGILSRADPADPHRCYISPTSEWKGLIKAAKNKV